MCERVFAVRQVITKADNPNISMSAVDLKGINKRILNPTNAVYICVTGVVTFCMGEGDKLRFKTLHPGNSVFISSNTPYFDFSNKGTTMLAINRSAYDQENIKELPIPDELLSSVQRMMTTP